MEQNKTYHYLYKIINLTNGMYYIGMHSTDDLDDEYMGSGRFIKEAIRAEGKENFKKEILEWFDNKDAMKAREAEVVDLTVMHDPKSYNACVGGNGGNTWLGRKHTPEQLEKMRQHNWMKTEKARQYFREHNPMKNKSSRDKISAAAKEAYRTGKRVNWLSGKHCSDELKEKISERLMGHPVSEETKQKLKEAWKRRRLHPTEKELEARKQNKYHFLGHHHTAETKERMSRAQKGIPNSEECRRKLSEKMRGRHRHRVPSDKTKSGWTWVYDD